MKFLLHISAALLAVLAFSSCATQTPRSRIANNPAQFNRLPEKHKHLVEQGQITKGMSPDAVLLASFRERGIVVGRPFPPLLDYLRVSIGSEEEMALFVNAFREILAA